MELIIFGILFAGCIVFAIVASIYQHGYDAGKQSVKSSLPVREEALQAKETEFSKRKAEISKNNQEVYRKLEAMEKRLKKRQADINKFEKELAQREETLNTKTTDLKISLHDAKEAFPWLAYIYSDIDAKRTEAEAEMLQHKIRPASTAADTVRKVKQEKMQAVHQAKLFEYRAKYYESLFPWLEDYLDLSPQEALDAVGPEREYSSEYDAVKEWLSPYEYESLPNAEKWQLALDHYKNRKKSKWQLGIEYERYIGYSCERHGYKVHYIGATEGLEDMGRDLIAEKGSVRYIIQCKRWSQDKTIHEKHIFQLYGTVVLYNMKSPVNATGVFVTTTSLSHLARDCAAYLGILVRENIPLQDYPIIKCNVSKTGERIYHLPFDQQYDRTMLNPADGDFYAATIAEAEAAGFRRAFRWYGAS